MSNKLQLANAERDFIITCKLMHFRNRRLIVALVREYICLDLDIHLRHQSFVMRTEETSHS